MVLPQSVQRFGWRLWSSGGPLCCSHGCSCGTAPWDQCRVTASLKRGQNCRTCFGEWWSVAATQGSGLGPFWPPGLTTKGLALSDCRQVDGKLSQEAGSKTKRPRGSRGVCWRPSPEDLLQDWLGCDCGLLKQPHHTLKKKTEVAGSQVTWYLSKSHSVLSVR